MATETTKELFDGWLQRLIKEDPLLFGLKTANGSTTLSQVRGRVCLFASGEAAFTVTLGQVILDSASIRIGLIENNDEIRTKTCGTILAKSLTWKWKEDGQPVRWFLWYREVGGIGMPVAGDLKSIGGQLTSV